MAPEVTRSSRFEVIRWAQGGVQEGLSRPCTQEQGNLLPASAVQPWTFDGHWGTAAPMRGA